MIHAAGIMFMTDESEVLLLKRGPGSDYPGAWCFPGGRQEDGESIEDCAKREAIEELGFLPKGDRVVLTRSITPVGPPVNVSGTAPPVSDAAPSGGPADQNDQVDYTTFLQRVKEKFDPELNGEHTGFMWVEVGSLAETFGRTDADFSEDDHPRDADGKFAKTAEGAAAGEKYHTEQSAKYQGVQGGHYHRPHNRAAKGYGAALKAFESGDVAGAEKLFAEAEKHGMEADKRVKRYLEKQGITGDPKPTKEEKTKEEKTSSSSDKSEPLSRREFIEEIETKSYGKRDQGEMAFHTTSWEHAPRQIQKAIANTAQLEGVVRETGKSAHYKPVRHIINMAGYNPNSKEGKAVWRHEFGHAMDFNGQRQPRSLKAIESVRSDSIGLQKMPGVAEMFNELKEKTKDMGPASQSIIASKYTREAYEKVTSPLRAQVRTDETVRFLLPDFIGAMTKNKVGWGHPNNYYTGDNGDSMRCTEMFANYVALTSGDHGEEVKDLLHTLAPKSCAHFDKIIAGEA